MADQQGDRFREALACLADIACEKVAGHPAGHLTQGRPLTLELPLEIPLDKDRLAEAAGRQTRLLEAEVDRLVTHHAAFLPGRIYCPRCGTAECEHAVPTDSRQVFTGFGASGLPRFLDFGQWLLEMGDPRIEALYHQPPKLLTEVTSGRDLLSGLLPAFRDRRIDLRIHGQVAAGWFPIPGQEPRRRLLALTFQVVSSPRRRGGRRLGLHVVGAGLDGEPLERLYERLEERPWTPAVEWGQSVLGSIERAQKRRRPAARRQLGRRIEGLLKGLARRLAHDRRSRDRKTHHARDRHAQGDRPTRMAVADLTEADPRSFLFDTRQKTLVVLGDRGRAHVWSGSGKLVTSIRYSPESIAKKRRKEIWRPASDEEIAGLKSRLGL